MAGQRGYGGRREAGGGGRETEGGRRRPLGTDDGEDGERRVKKGLVAVVVADWKARRTTAGRG